MKLATLGSRPEAIPVDWRAVERQARAKLADWRGLLTRNIGEARQLLRELLDGAAIQITPFDERGRRGFRFKGVVKVGGLLEGFAPANNMRGKWRPHRERRPSTTHSAWSARGAWRSGVAV